MDILEAAKKFVEKRDWTVSTGISGNGILLKNKRCSPQGAVILAMLAVGKGKRFAPVANGTDESEAAE